MNDTTVTTPSELEIRVERIFDAPRAHVYSVWTDPALIPEWWGDGTVVEEMDVRPGGAYRFRTAYGVVEGEFQEVEPPARLVQTFQDHLQTLEFEDWRGKTLARVRALIKEADPEIVEEWKWAKASSPGTPVWSHDGIVCTGETYKSVVKLTFLKGASLPDPA